MESKLRGLPEEQEFFLTDENAKKITMYSIINTFTELARIKAENDPSISALDSYFSQRPPLDRVKLKYSAIEVAGDRTKGSIFASMLVKLTVFTFENVAKMTAEAKKKNEIYDVYYVLFLFYRWLYPLFYIYVLDARHWNCQTENRAA